MFEIYLIGLMVAAPVAIIVLIVAFIDIEPMDLDEWGQFFFVFAVSFFAAILWPIALGSLIPGAIIWGLAWGLREFIFN